MTQNQNTSRWAVISILVTIFLTLVACGLLPRTPAPAETLAVPVLETPDGTQTPGLPGVSPEASTTLEPSSTPVADLVLLLALSGSDPNQTLRFQEVLSELVAAENLRFEVRTELAAIDLGPTVRLAVVLPPDPGVMNLAGANPRTQFLAVGMQGLQAGSNISLIGGGGVSPDQRAFVAGYLAAVITPDWRAGVIYPAGTTAGKAARTAFLKGLVFYCGLCRPAYPPFVQYPSYAEIAPGASPADAQAAVDILKSNAVQTVYVAPEVDGQALFDALAAANMGIIAGSAPPASVADHWVASLRVDEAQALRLAWDRLMAGEGGILVEVPLAVTDRNPARLSTGRLRLVEELMASLLSGYIDTGVNPETGDPK